MIAARRSPRDEVAAGATAGRPRPAALLREALAVAATQRVASVLVGLVSAAVAAVVLATTGQSAAAEHAVLARIDEAGTRTIVATDADGTAGLDASAVTRVAAIGGVETIVGLGPVSDVRGVVVGDAGRPVPLRTVHGDVGDVLELVQGRWPGEREIVVGPGGMRRLGLVEAAGGVADGEQRWAVVGRYTAGAPLEHLEDGAVALGASDPGEPLRSVHVLVSAPEDVDRVAAAMRPALGVTDVASVRVEVPETLTTLRAAVRGELGRFSRRLALLVLAVGLVVVAVTVHAAVTLRRRDFGRRRALGASRSTIVGLVLGQTLAAATPGALVGSAVGLAVVQRLAGGLPATSFVVGVGVLTVLSALCAAIGPAVAAARRDPVRVLRVP